MDSATAQDPVLPPTNLGMANVYDGMAGKPGFIYQSYVQVFRAQNYYDQFGTKKQTDFKLHSLSNVQQLIYLSPVKLLGGTLAFTAIVPIVQLSATRTGGDRPLINSSVLGDIIEGTAIQWSDKKLFGKPFSHRAEFDISFPLGNFDHQYDINPSFHAWTFSAYHAFTMILNSRMSISSRNQINYNGTYIDTKDKAGSFYNGNYSIDFSIVPAMKVELVAYYLKQITPDKHDGSSHYYQDAFGIDNTKETALGFGPCIAYFSPGRTLIEAKVFFETAENNRFSGYRPTIRVAVPLMKQ
ncbi:SphA family protein [Niastella yeongjuensis]|nr:transporter [Niastella yeongjuensis]